MNAIALTFNDTPFTVIDRNNQPWLKQSEIACALYGVKKGGGQSDAPFKNAEKSLKRLYARNADEFTDSMTALVELETNGGKQQVRIFSLRGCQVSYQVLTGFPRRGVRDAQTGSHHLHHLLSGWAPCGRCRWRDAAGSRPPAAGGSPHWHGSPRR